MEHWLEQTSEHIRQAVAQSRVLSIQGGNSKSFYGNSPRGEALETGGYSGIVEYQPRELTVTARAGTLLSEIEVLLAENNQMLPFEPPHFGANATLGGCLAAGLSGPRRPYAGAVRDAVLGVHLLDGRGQHLKFGGRVIKNVAGYDVSRLLAGSLGTLGVICEASFKVLPRPECERTLLMEMSQDEAIATMNSWAGRPLPLSATAWVNDHLRVRLSGTESAVNAALKKLGGEQVKHGDEFWLSLKEHTLPEFDGATAAPVWRLSLPSTSPAFELMETFLVEWGGSVRWVRGDLPAKQIRQALLPLGGHATRFYAASLSSQGAFSQLSQSMVALQQRVRKVFDPHGVFDTGRM